MLIDVEEDVWLIRLRSVTVKDGVIHKVRYIPKYFTFSSHLGEF